MRSCWISSMTQTSSPVSNADFASFTQDNVLILRCSLGKQEHENVVSVRDEARHRGRVAGSWAYLQCLLAVGLHDALPAGAHGQQVHGVDWRALHAALHDAPEGRRHLLSILAAAPLRLRWACHPQDASCPGLRIALVQ